MKSFWTWVRAKRHRLAATVAASLAVVTYVVSAFERTRAFLPPEVQTFLAERPSFAPALLHVALIAVLLVGFLQSHLTRIQDVEDQLPREAQAARQLWRAWAALWVAWLVTYLYNTFEWAAYPPTIDHSLTRFPVGADVGSRARGMSFDMERANDLVSNLLNNVTGILFFVLYWILDEPTVEIAVGGVARRKPKSTPWLSIVAVLVLLFAAELAHQAVGWHPSWKLAFSVGSGLISATAMALFIGRLESKNLALPRAVIVALYAYASIQPLFPFLEDHPKLRVLTVVAVLALKTVLFFAVWWTYEEGRLFYYLSRTAFIEDNDKKIFPAFRDRYLSSRPQAPVVADADAPAPRVAIANSLSVFVSVPMSSLPEDVYGNVMRAAVGCVDTLEAIGMSVYCAASRRPQELVLPVDALEDDLDALRACDVFVLIYPMPLPSSVLVEAGVALALEKQCIFLYKAELPFLLMGSDRLHHCKLVRYSDDRELPLMITSKWTTWVKKTS